VEAAHGEAHAHPDLPLVPPDEATAERVARS
jgi:hypothetical protein